MSDSTLLWRYSIELGNEPNEGGIVARQALGLLLHALADAVERGVQNRDQAYVLPTEIRIVWEMGAYHTRFAAGLIRIDEETQSGEH